MGDSSELRFNPNSDEHQDAKQQRQQTYSSLSRNSAQTGSANPLSSTSKLHNGLSLAQRAN